MKWLALAHNVFVTKGEIGIDIGMNELLAKPFELGLPLASSSYDFVRRGKVCYGADPGAALGTNDSLDFEESGRSGMAGIGKDEWPFRPITCLSPIRSEWLPKATDQTYGHSEVERLFRVEFVP